jgi:60 kDa SS-A/Ro ribonucleoprotein
MNIFKNIFRGRMAGTSQLVAQAGRDQVENAARGYVYALDPMERVDRFLILGSEGGTYYATERALTQDNALHLAQMVRTNGTAVVHRIVAICEAGRAPKVSPAIFALAMCAGFGDEATRRLALGYGLQTVCRTGSHLLEFASYIEQFRGWGRGLRSGVRAWYESKTVGELAYQAVKYQNRSGFTHRDLMRLAHPVASDEARRALYAWIVRGTVPGAEPELALVRAFEHAKTLAEPFDSARSAGSAQDDNVETCAALVREAKLPREAVPTNWLREPLVWEALLETMPMTAAIRNLATMTRVGLLTPKSAATRTILERLHDTTRLTKARVHPIAILSALETYRSGRGVRGNATWTPVQAIVEALDDAFYLAFRTVEPSGARILVGLDVSGSMSTGTVAGVHGLTPRTASTAMAMTHVRAEADVRVMAFTTNFVKLEIDRNARLAEVMRTTEAMPYGGTDCSLPMLYAIEQRLEVDTFVIYTDSETWAGTVHPDEALRRYRSVMGRPAKLVTVGMTSTGFTIADPNDAGMLDIVGFDTSAPALISDFGKPERSGT